MGHTWGGQIWRSRQESLHVYHAYLSPVVWALTTLTVVTVNQPCEPEKAEKESTTPQTPNTCLYIHVGISRVPVYIGLHLYSWCRLIHTVRIVSGASKEQLFLTY